MQKLTELGIDRIVPLHTDRSVVRWSGDRGRDTVERLRRVAREAAAQCRRVWLPEVAETVPFAELPTLGAAGEVALAQLSGDRPTVAHHVVAVGPEGGWSDAELASGLPTVGFGLSVLRAETAAVTAAALLASLRRAPSPPLPALPALPALRRTRCRPRRWRPRRAAAVGRDRERRPGRTLASVVTGRPVDRYIRAGDTARAEGRRPRA